VASEKQCKYNHFKSKTHTPPDFFLKKKQRRKVAGGTQATGWFDTYRGNTNDNLPYMRRVLRTGCGRVGYRVSEFKDNS
jgi:hypothetical protein